MGGTTITKALLAFNAPPPLNSPLKTSPTSLSDLITSLNPLLATPITLSGDSAINLDTLLASLSALTLTHFHETYTYPFTTSPLPKPPRLSKPATPLALTSLVSCYTTSPQSIAGYILTRGLSSSVPRAYGRNVASDLTSAIKECLATKEQGVWRAGGMKKVYEDGVGFIGNYCIEASWVWCVVEVAEPGREAEGGKREVMVMWYAGCGYETKEMPPPMNKGGKGEEWKRRSITF